MKLHNNTKSILYIILASVFCLNILSFTPSSISKNNHLPLEKAFKFKISEGDLPDWATMDPDKDGYEGTRTKTFYEYLKTLNPAPSRNNVTVAVIDDGFDIDHPDLKENIWENKEEVNGTEGIDDDNNGYVDDFHGWNFLGNEHYLSLEVAREYKRLQKLNIPESDEYLEKLRGNMMIKKMKTMQ